MGKRLLKKNLFGIKLLGKNLFGKRLLKKNLLGKKLSKMKSSKMNLSKMKLSKMNLLKKNLSHITAFIMALTLIFTASFSFADAKTVTYSYSVESRLFSTVMLRDYVKPDTPSFSPLKDSNTFLTSEERIDYLTRLVSKTSNMYMFLDESCPDTPIILFTSIDLSGAKTFSEAASILAQSEKINIFYQAQVHGNEPAAGEGALYFLSRLSQNSSYAYRLSSKANLCVVPCANPKAADLQVRQLKNGYNINRDHLYAGSRQTRLLHRIYDSLNPEVVIDGHECLPNHQKIKATNQRYFTDIFIGATESLNVDPVQKRWSASFRDRAIADCNQAGLRASFYDNGSIAVNNSVSRTYYALQGSVTILMESEGINLAKGHFDRRVYSHYKAVTSILDSVIYNASAIKKDVKAVRENIAEEGKTYSSENRFILKQMMSGDNYKITSCDLFDFNTGTLITPVDYRVHFYDKAVRSRPLPTAYIISKKSKKADLIMKKLGYSGVEYFELKPGTKIAVNGYKGNGKKASVTSKKTLDFFKGAYLIPMDQTKAKVVAACLEPDIAESAEWKGTYVQAGLIKAKEIYRYTKDNPREALEEYIIE